MIYLPIYAKQAEFLDSPARFRGFVGGRGCGKSWIGAYDLWRRARPRRLYMVVAPTYPTLRDTSLRSFAEVGARLKRGFVLNKSEMHARLDNGAEVLFRSAEHPDRLRGPNLSGVWIDEASLTEEEAYKIAIGCLREAAETGWLSATFTPQGKLHWTYTVLGKGKPDTSLTRATTWDNPFLPEDFADTIAGQYTSHFRQQELGGEFIDPPGKEIQRHWLRRVDALPVCSVWVRYWDKAATPGSGAHTAGVLMGKTVAGVYCVADVRRGQWSSGTRNHVMQETAKDDARNYSCLRIWVEQEPGSGGKESAEISVRELAGHDVRAETVTGDKAARIRPFAAQAEAGNVLVLEADWTEDYVEELIAFPDGQFKDQADATSGAFNKLAGMSAVQTIDVPERGERHMGGVDLDQRW